MKLYEWINPEGYLRAQVPLNSIESVIIQASSHSQNGKPERWSVSINWKSTALYRWFDNYDDALALYDDVCQTIQAA